MGKNHTTDIAVFIQGACPYLFNAHTMICIFRGKADEISAFFSSDRSSSSDSVLMYIRSNF